MLAVGCLATGRKFLSEHSCLNKHVCKLRQCANKISIGLYKQMYETIKICFIRNILIACARAMRVNISRYQLYFYGITVRVGYKYLNNCIETQQLISPAQILYICLCEFQ